MAADLDHAGAVEHDDQVGHPHGAEPVRHQDHDAPPRASGRRPTWPGRWPAYRSNSACSVSASRAAVGSSSTSSSGSSRMKPRARASFCHCPKETSTPSGQAGPSWVPRPAAELVHHVVGAGPADGGGDGRLVVEPGHVADARRSAGRAARTGRSPGTRRPGGCATASAGMRGQVDPVDQDPARGRVVELGQQLHQGGLAGAVLADDGDDRAGRQRAGSRPRSTSSVGARVGERDVASSSMPRVQRGPAPARRLARRTTAA